MMTVRVDARGSTYDIYFPTVGLHSDVRPAEGDLPQSRSHFRAIVGGLAIGRRLDWFTERLSWEAFQHYQGRHQPPDDRADLAERADPGAGHRLRRDGRAACRRTAGGTDSPGQYIKRFRVKNEGTEPRRALFGVYIQAEVNGGIGEPGLSWHDGDRTLLATNRGHGHANRKLARDATIEFAVALDGRGDVHCEPTGPNEAILLRWLDLPGGRDGDRRPAGQRRLHRLAGRPRDVRALAPPRPGLVPLGRPRPGRADARRRSGTLRRAACRACTSPSRPTPSASGARPWPPRLHADAQWGAIASGFDRGLSAYCWPRDAIWVGGAMERLGHPEIGRGVFQWLAKVRGQNRPYAYWFQKYTIDGGPEWETPAVDQTAIDPLGPGAALPPDRRPRVRRRVAGR